MESEQQNIGMATMDDQRTITLLLCAEDDSGIRGKAQFVYPVDHEKYQEILKHIGDLNPGEEKLVPPWPS